MCLFTNFHKKTSHITQIVRDQKQNWMRCYGLDTVLHGHSTNRNHLNTEIIFTWYICCYGLDKNKIAATNFKLQNKLRRIQTDYLIVLKAKKNQKLVDQLLQLLCVLRIYRM